MIRLAVLVSGRGSNLEAILKAVAAGRVAAQPVLVMSDNPQAPALQIARDHRVPALGVSPRALGGREAFFRLVEDTLVDARVDLIALAGFMRLLPSRLVDRFRWRILNVHPSLLPAFPGLDAPRQALEYGVRVTGCTVHFVDEGVDTGPIVLQAAVPVLADDTPETLATRIRREEHRIYPEAIRLLAEGRLVVDGRRVRIV
ncbi:MAG: phosphoribosylglycinamide formyltransferase [Firmicutes bacterium ZCTH02-B6]|nr:MAG: phosphoribosylglycinamide formyltransferase [Firmicutes bacterium ZCTH02-B6]